ncbi:Lrp/AsnC family transcriptional regulator [Geomicrobium sediminis]|uniref:DNA-binding Lrp family transcriptional regulator n=1 Tax=Geomicrobium sediminis TaxID=1347788 RepID=A0ABS2PIB9_9BACL|nr:Lrp/AsnC family transcriptional regulator [Geomicrobium sediminis]MBM7635027.1 DNA-binding Lrp family transcriptional regulator [Geomicrobium sediminis]
MVKLIDSTDRQLLKALQENAQIANVDLAKRINLSPSATHTRRKRLESEGIILSYETTIDRQALGYDLLCFIYIAMNAHQRDDITQFQHNVTCLPEVLECHHVTGEYDYILKVVLKNTNDLKHFIVEHLSSLPSVTRIQTTVSYGEVKQTTALPL